MCFAAWPSYSTFSFFSSDFFYSDSLILEAVDLTFSIVIATSLPSLTSLLSAETLSLVLSSSLLLILFLLISSSYLVRASMFWWAWISLGFFGFTPCLAFVFTIDRVPF